MFLETTTNKLKKDNLLGSLTDLKSYSRSRLPKKVSRLILTKILNKENPYKHYNDIHHCIFVHIPKTGGTSISKALFGAEFGHCTVDHYEIFSPERFHNYFKFGFVRNPWDRLLSAYKFLKKGGMYSADKTWSDIYLSEFENFEHFVLSLKNKRKANGILRGTHFIPQYKFVCDYKLKVKLDFLGRFENIDLDFDFINSKLGLYSQLKHLNKSNNASYCEFYSDEMIKIVSQVYREDILIFNYKFS
jgi:chondroitin 4-sulfotransferase 11